MARQLSGIFVLALLLSGCMMDPVRVEKDFGNSVRQMVEAQIYDPAAASRPQIAPPELIDGVAASESMLGYREAAKRKTDDSERTGFNLTID